MRDDRCLTVYFDGYCPVCRREVGIYRRLHAPGAIDWQDLALLIANLSAAMVGIWAVHHGCEHDGFVARRSRWPLLDRMVGNMFPHLEHHLYPAAPTCRLPELARRFDATRVDPLRPVHPVRRAAMPSSAFPAIAGEIAP